MSQWTDWHKARAAAAGAGMLPGEELRIDRFLASVCMTCEGDGDVCVGFGIDSHTRPGIVRCPDCAGTGQAPAATSREGPMPEPVRMPAEVISALMAACSRHPSQRVMQVIVNALGIDPFYVEDEDAIRKLYEYANGGPGA